MEIFIRRHDFGLNVEVFIVSKVQDLKQGDVLSFFNFNQDGVAQVKRKVYGEEGYIKLDELKPAMILPEHEFRGLMVDN